jgi:sulfonate transport system substrate-binding protein
MGVPEAFNIPLTATVPTVDAEFVPAPGGTGAMLACLLATPPTADVCIALTECVVAAIENGAQVRILSPYVTSPLTWAICVAPGTGELPDLSDATWGVSRLGSGSHVMASVLARERGWKPPNFKVSQDFTGLLSDLKSGEIKAFLWEHYTTRPWEVTGELRFAGDVATPWGCFCAVVVHPQVSIDLSSVRTALEAVFVAGQAFEENAGGEAVKRVMSMSGMTLEDARSWHSAVRYARVGETMSDSELELARNTVRDAHVIDPTFKFSKVSDYCVPANVD